MVSFCLSTGIVVSCLVFYSRYFNGPISTDIDDWAGFATFCGFSLSLISIIFIFMTYRSQQELSSILQFESSFFQWLEMHNSIYNECKVDIEKYYDDPEEKKEYINIIQSNNELLLRLINDILDLSKIESGIIERRKENFNLAKVCNELFVTIQAKMTNPNVELRLDGPNSECWVLLDRNRLKQVWMNFLTNAVKCTKSGYIKMGYGIEREGLRIYVEDTGIGIPDDLHDKVFTRFEKLNEFSQGTGLGLTISRAIVEAAGGEVGFTSKLGVGSTFWAWLPLRP